MTKEIMNEQINKPFKRIAAIDNYKGIIIILMNFAGLVSSILAVPAFLKHPRDIGFSIVDIGAPAFMFVIALNYGSSFRRRAEIGGKGKAYGHFFHRYLGFLGLGAIAVAVMNIYTGEGYYWSVLHAIGFAGVLALFFIGLPHYARIGIGISFIIVYQVLLDLFFLDYLLTTGLPQHGGFIGAFAWAGMLIAFTGIVDLCKNSKLRLLIAASALAVMFLISLFFFKVPVSKNRIDSSYCFLTMGIAILCYMLAGILFGEKRVPFISWWGENSMLFYLIDMIVIALATVLVGGTEKYAALPAWSVAIILPISLSVMMTIAYLIHKKGLIVKL